MSKNKGCCGGLTEEPKENESAKIETESECCQNEECCSEGEECCSQDELDVETTVTTINKPCCGGR